MKGWFGETWGSPVCTETRHLPTPVGTSCVCCRVPIEAKDCGIIAPLLAAYGNEQHEHEGFVYHLDCWVAQFLAGIAEFLAGPDQGPRRDGPTR